MPFIQGRYHINPVAGQALEAARQLEEALLEHLQEEPDKGSAQGDPLSGSGQAEGQGPIHRVEIEAFQAVPSHSGRAVKKFAAKVHRAAPANSSSTQPPQQSSTHVFQDPNELVDFLQQEFSKDCGK